MNGLFRKQKTAAFSQKAKNCLLDVCWIVEDTSKANASDVASQISSLRDETGQKCCPRLIGLILQPVIYPNKNWFIEEVPFCKYERGRRDRCR